VHTSAHKRTQAHTSALKRTQAHSSALKRTQALASMHTHTCTLLQHTRFHAYRRTHTHGSVQSTTAQHTFSANPQPVRFKFHCGGPLNFMVSQFCVHSWILHPSAHLPNETNFSQGPIPMHSARREWAPHVLCSSARTLAGAGLGTQKCRSFECRLRVPADRIARKQSVLGSFFNAASLLALSFWLPSPFSHSLCCNGCNPTPSPQMQSAGESHHPPSPPSWP